MGNWIDYWNWKLSQGNPVIGGGSRSLNGEWDGGAIGSGSDGEESSNGMSRTIIMKDNIVGKNFKGRQLIAESPYENPDPCAEGTFTRPTDVVNKVSAVVDQKTATIVAKSGGGEGKKEIIIIDEPEEVESPTIIQLSVPEQSIEIRSVSGGTEILGNNFVANDLDACKYDHNDSYAIFGEGEGSFRTVVWGWKIENEMELPLCSYASGMTRGGDIYVFGGNRNPYNAVGIDDFFKYDIDNNKFVSLDPQGLTARSNGYGWFIDGSFFVYGGYTYGNTGSFVLEFHRRNGNGWTQLPVPMHNIINKMVGGHGKLYIGNAMSAGGNGTWEPFHLCLEYDVKDNSWSAPYNGLDYEPELQYNFDSFIFHKGVLYYYNEGRLMKILPDQFQTTLGVEIPIKWGVVKMASYEDYIIFSHGVGDDNETPIRETYWYNTKTGFFGHFEVSRVMKPMAILGFDIWVYKDTLYLIGGQNQYNMAEKLVWSLDLKMFFKTLNTECAVRIPPDTYREIIIKRTAI